MKSVQKSKLINMLLVKFNPKWHEKKVGICGLTFKIC